MTLLFMTGGPARTSQAVGTGHGPTQPEGHRRDVGPFSAKLKNGGSEVARSTWGFRTATANDTRNRF